MPNGLSVEELVIDDSFISYCLQKDEVDVLYWQQYLRDNPFEKNKMEEARQIVLGLHLMLKQIHSGDGVYEGNQMKNDHFVLKSIFKKRFLRAVAAIAASVIMLLMVGVLIRNSIRGDDQQHLQAVANHSADKIYFFRTLNGEKKTVILSDSTKILLNADSELQIDRNYGSGNRKVYLKGEALFEVTHDDSIPFIVSTDKYEVKDLGTVFNVKSYPNEEESETSLIEGKVEINLKQDNRKILLSPNQKVVFSNKNDRNNEPVISTKQGLSFVADSEIKLSALSYSPIDSTVIETAWAKNRLEIVNEDFFEMEKKLERWYDVDIHIESDEVGKYPFTATFEKENIQEVLQALQYAYHFNYSIKDKKISISK